MAVFFFNAVNITSLAPLSWAWQTVDLSPYLPAEATIAVFKFWGGYCGVRKPASGYANLGQTRVATLMSGVTAQKVEIYRVSNASVYLIGYLNEAEAGNTTVQDISPVVLGSWQTITCPVPSNAVAAILDTYSDNSYKELRFRPIGSTDNRTADSVTGTHWSAVVGLNASKQLEVWLDAAGGQNVYLVGYLISNITYKTNAVEYSLTTTNAWTGKSFAADPAYTAQATGAIIEVNCTDTGLSNTGGFRYPGSADDIYSNSFSEFHLVPIDSMGTLEGKIAFTTMDWWLWGFTNTPPPFVGLNKPLPKLTFQGSTAPATGLIKPLPKLTFQGSLVPVARLNKPLPKLRFEGSFAPISHLNKPLPKLTIIAYAGEEIVSATLAIEIPLLDFSVTTLINKTAIVAIEIPLLDFSASANVSRNATIGIEIPILDFSATGYITKIATIGIEIPLLDFEVSATISRIAIIAIEIPLLEMLVYTNVSAASYDSTIPAVIINTKNNAHTEYSNYRFNSFCYFNGHWYGARDYGTGQNGIVLLEGANDLGTVIDAYFKTGEVDTWRGSESMPPTTKHNFEMWLAHTGAMKCKVIGDTDGTYAYPVQIDGRVVMGRGLRDRFKSFKFQNSIGDTGLVTLNVVSATNKFTRASGSFITASFEIADKFTASGFGSGVDGDYTIESVSALEIVTVETIPADVTGGGNERLLCNPDFAFNNARLKADGTRGTR